MGDGDQRSTESGIPIKVVYGPADLDGFDPATALGEPGRDPFTRGVYPTMYRGRPWTMRQYAGFGSAAETNARFRYLLEHGQTGLSVAFDLPTQMGYDSDHPMAAAEVGKVGVAIDSLADMRRLFEGIPLDQVSTSMTINAPAAIKGAAWPRDGAGSCSERGSGCSSWPCSCSSSPTGATMPTLR